jgi:hypothetical protein
MPVRFGVCVENPRKVLNRVAIYPRERRSRDQAPELQIMLVCEPPQPACLHEVVVIGCGLCIPQWHLFATLRPCSTTSVWSVRALRHHKTFAVAALGTVALSIGATNTLFSSSTACSSLSEDLCRPPKTLDQRCVTARVGNSTLRR